MCSSNPFASKSCDRDIGVVPGVSADCEPIEWAESADPTKLVESESALPCFGGCGGLHITHPIPPRNDLPEDRLLAPRRSIEPIEEPIEPIEEPIEPTEEPMEPIEPMEKPIEPIEPML